MVGSQLDVMAAHFEGKGRYLTELGFNVSLPTGLGISCSLIIFSYVSKLSIALVVFLVRIENFS